MPVTRRKLLLVATKVTSCTGTQPLRSLPLNKVLPPSFLRPGGRDGLEQKASATSAILLQILFFM